MIDSILSPGDKFALIALPGVLNEIEFESGYISPGLSAFRRFPLEMDEHWKEMLGSLQIDLLGEASMCLMAISPSSQPSIFDAENTALKVRVKAFRDGLYFSGFFGSLNNRQYLLSGGRPESLIDIRQYIQLSPPSHTRGTPLLAIDSDRISEAASLGMGWVELSQTEAHQRLKATIRAFLRGMNEFDIGERLHQFVRCIEGFLLLEPGKSRRRFKSRTELFVGSAHHEWMEELFELRSAAEHLNDMSEVIRSEDLRTKRLTITRRAYEAEAIARYCVRRILCNRDLWPFYENDETAERFWALADGDRKSAWGPLLEVDEMIENFLEAEISDTDLGLS